MSLKQKIITIPTVITIVGVLALWYATSNPGRPEPSGSDGQDEFVLSVKWFPQLMPMHSDVHITVTANGYPLMARRVRASPWGETVLLPKGTTVVLTALSAHPATGLLDCIIMLNGRSVPRTGFDSVPAPGTVRCEA